jgi:2-alkyl-3-oxoalkanoate reductase
MRVFVAGGTGVLGRRLIPKLVASGHQVTAMSRSAAKGGAIEALGAQPAFADALDRDAVIRAVTQARPEAVIHQMTALAGLTSLRRFDHAFAATNRLRTAGTDHLLEAARAAGARRFIAQSYTNWTNPREGGPVKNEEDPLDRTPPEAQRQTLQAIEYLERTVTGANGLAGLALRYGNFYGPGTGFAHGGAIVEAVRRRQFPIVGSGAGVWSFIHVDDAAEATVLALSEGGPGKYNITDDEPAPVSIWLPELAAILGAKPPRHVPAWVGWLFLGSAGVSMMTRGRGSSNERAKRTLGWRLRYPTWRTGFREELAPVGGAETSAR